MNREEFLFCWKSGFKISKILEFLDVDDFEKGEVLTQFKQHFLRELKLCKRKNPTNPFPSEKEIKL